MSPLIIFYLVMVTVSGLCAISSCDFFLLWVSLEINSMCLLAVIGDNANAGYFMAQIIGSLFMLLGIATMFDLACTMGVMINAGIAPLHLWVPRVISKLSWPICFIFSTWQKVPAICLIISLNNAQGVLFLAGVIGVVVSALGAANETSLRNIMAFSSVGHMAWIMAASAISASCVKWYFFSYCIVCVPLFIHVANSYSDFPPAQDLSFGASIFSMAGIPPFVGFFANTWVVFFVDPFFIFFFMFSSAIIIYVYGSISFSLIKGANRVNALGSFFVLLMLVVPSIIIIGF